MITLTGKTTNYNVANESGQLKLSGQVTVQEDGRISNFNGTFNKDENGYAGNFYYSESEEGKSNKSTSDVDTADHLAFDNFLDSTITELQNEFNQE